MKKVLVAVASLCLCPVFAVAGPREDSFQVIEEFKRAFDASDVDAVVKLFSSDALFLGTVSPTLATTTEQISKYFQGIKQSTPRSITIESYESKVISENAVLFAGMDTFTQTKEGKTISTSARFTFLITKTDQGWRIFHFHSSVRPAP
jgi:uncharacterized protein (TIGR02246 family)